MTLRGIDVSNWQQATLKDVSKTAADFVICKATGGDSFVDRSCDRYIQQARGAGMLYGFYHFACDDGKHDPEEEAVFFVNNCKGYFGEGVPVLDWECPSWTQERNNPVTVDWVNRFVRKVHAMTGVWCWIYANPWRFTGKVEANCARWVASYPNIKRPTLRVSLKGHKCPSVTGLAACWQFASDGKVSGHGDNYTDLNEFFGDADAWRAYARGDNKELEVENSTNGAKVVETIKGSRYTVTIAEN